MTDPLTVSFDNIGATVPSYRVTDSTGAAVDLTDLTKFQATTLRSRPQTGVDTHSGYTVDYKFPLTTAVPVTVKVGGRVEDTTRNISDPVYNRTGNTVATGFGGTSAITGAKLAGLTDTGFSQHPIGYGLPAYNFVSLYSAFTQLGGMAEVPYTPASDTQARFDDTTKAGYVRVDVTPVEHLLVVGGVRYEDRETDAQNRLTTLPAPVNGKFTDKRFFPSINLKYSATNNLVFRAGYSKSIGLPDYSDLLPLTQVTAPNQSTGARGSVKVYNPTLQAYHVDNYDAGVEYYFNKSGYVSASIFRKTFTNYIATVTQALTPAGVTQLGLDPSTLTSTIDQYDVSYKLNVPEPAHYNGIEVGFAQNFTFLPKPFNTLGLQVNATLISVDPINSHVVFSSTDANLNADLLHQVNKNLEIAAVKQALNVELNYSIGKFGINIVTNYTGHVLRTGGVVQKTVQYSDIDPATGKKVLPQYYDELNYQAPRELVDVRIDYKWNSRFTPYFQARNIFARPIVGSTPIEPFNYATYGDPIYEIGVRGIW